MSLGKRINPFSKVNNDTGFGNKADSFGGRFINKDGSYNIKKTGIPFTKRMSVYQTMLDMPRGVFIITILFFFLVVNVLYTLIYLLFGLDSFQGFIATTNWGKMKELFFFSTETFTTVGYGRINPIGDGANLMAAIEALSGFLSFAIATGLMYGRFSKARAHIQFSEHAVIAPYRGGTGLMFRLASYKNKHALSDVTIQVNAGLLLSENGSEPTYKFYELPLERSRVETLMMNWTVVHPIDESSPFYGFSSEDMHTADLEIYVTIRGFDNIYSNTVLKRTSYTHKEIVFNAKFVQMYHESEDGKTTIFELDKLGQYTPAD
ncbi:MAG: ion channel [Arachidicoccus sp.]|nr:ion channel [Arachidicoccus sp.]